MERDVIRRVQIGDSRIATACLAFESGTTS